MKVNEILAAGGLSIRRECKKNAYAGTGRFQREEKTVFGFSVRCVFSFFRETLHRVSNSVVAGSI